ncbi:DUF1648 domain-containing protein [Streptosporangium fragile]|uniref:DUF1648 domain-containing protein n=1 Tax=Streptosporangium fragile TaxID=46186 RepID=A0ABP6IXJ7_9ACTN
MGLRGRFLFAAAGWFALVTAALVAAPLTLWSRLPDPVAVHWGLSGAPDGSMPLAALLLLDVGLWALVAVGACAPALGRAAVLRRRAGRMGIGALLGGVGLFFVGLQASTLWANLDAPGWRQAAHLGWGVVVPLAGLLAGGALGALAGRPGPDEPPPRADVPVRGIRLRHGQRAVWVSSVRNGWLTVIGGALLASGIALCVLTLIGGDRTLLPPSAVTAVAGLAAVTFGSVHVQITGDGLLVAYGPLRHPRRRIPLAKVERAWSEELFPAQVGGWGLRGLPGASTIMIRGGECLVVGYVSGGRLTVSIDDAASGAALLNTLVAGASAGPALRR